MHDMKRLMKRRNINVINNKVEEIVEPIIEEVVEEVVEPTVFVCPYCDKKYKTERGLNNHIKAKHEDGE